MSLKRFKHGRQKFVSYYSGGGGGKLETPVDFELEGLNLDKFILQRAANGEHYVYDLFGISNHFGGCGGGHYTAYGLNWMENQWYSYDDSSCSKVSNHSRMVSSSAYNLFYRRRGKIDLNSIDYERIRQSANEEDLRYLLSLKTPQ